MTRFSRTTLLSLAGAVALLAGACGSSKSSTTTGSGGSGASTGGGGAGGASSGNPFAGMGDLLMPSPTGFVDDRTVSGVIGAWFAYGDSVGSNAGLVDGGADPDTADSDCVKKAGLMASQCSQIASPMPGGPFAPDPTTGAMCTHGIAAQVINNSSGTLDYTDIWGAGIGLDFNNPGAGLDGGPTAGYANLSNYSGIAFQFTGTDIPASSLRVNFPFMGEHGNDSPYDQGATMMNTPLTNGQNVMIHWSDIGGPLYLKQQTPPVDFTMYPFVNTAVQSIEFQVFTNKNTATAYNFCVNYLTLLN